MWAPGVSGGVPWPACLFLSLPAGPVPNKAVEPHLGRGCACGGDWLNSRFAKLSDQLSVGPLVW